MVSLDFVARSVVESLLNVRPGENVWINGWDHTTDLMSSLAFECRKHGCHVLLTFQPEDFWLRSILETPLELLESVPAHQAAALRQTDVYVFTLGPGRPVPWEEIPEERRRLVSVWLDTRYDRSKFADEWAAIAKKRKVRMLAIKATLATQERASAMGLDLEEWRNVMFAGCTVDWREVANRASILASFLSGDDEVHVSTPYGTDLRFRLDRRPLTVSDGLTSDDKAEKGLVTFLPAGGVETSANEDSAQGKVVYNLPIHAGKKIVEDLTVRVRDGRITEYSAKSGSEVFEGYLSAKGDLNRFAFFGFGLNPALRFAYTQDDKVLGGVTVGFGDNEMKGGRNRAGGMEWWAGMSNVTVTIGDSK